MSPWFLVVKLDGSRLGDGRRGKISCMGQASPVMVTIRIPRLRLTLTYSFLVGSFDNNTVYGVYIEYFITSCELKRIASCWLVTPLPSN